MDFQNVRSSSSRNLNKSLSNQILYALNKCHRMPHPHLRPLQQYLERLNIPGVKPRLDDELSKGTKYISCMNAKMSFSISFRFELTVPYCYSPFIQPSYQAKVYGCILTKQWSRPILSNPVMRCMINNNNMYICTFHQHM